MRILLFSGLFLFISLAVNGQSSRLPLGNDAYHILERMEIKAGKEQPSPFFSTLKPYFRRDVTAYAIQLEKAGMNFSKVGQKNIQYLYNDNNEWMNDETTAHKEDNTLYNDNLSYKKVYIDSTNTFYRLEPESSSDSPGGTANRYVTSKKPIFKIFYKTPANLWEVNKPNFTLRVNPILHLKFGKEQDDTGLIFQNTRGVDIRGGVDNVFWFHTNILENQTRFPIHVTERNLATTSVPGSGFYKPYESRVFNVVNGFDYLNAQGYLAFRVSKHIFIELGHARHFFGNGHRSLFLSDFSNNYFYLKLETRVWKFHYQNIFAELTGQFNANSIGDVTRPKKFMAAHHLSIDILPNLNIGLFESVIFDRGTTFELQYLNPIILYRTVEQAVGSPDNAMIGLDFKYNFLKRFSLYGQVLLDEFVFNELVVERRGWWANKFGIQLGLKYIDVLGVDHLDLQLEYNTVRPYTYSHRDETANYTHYNQPLAHPLGANFKEMIGILRYQPVYPLVFTGRLIYADYGTDANTDDNWGGDIFKSHLERSAPDGMDDEIGHITGQGVGNQLFLAHLTTSYQIKHNMFIDLNLWLRSQSSDVVDREYNRVYAGIGLRWNIADQILDY